MKHLILTVTMALTLMVCASDARALLGHVAAEKDRREHAEQQLDQEQRHNGQLLQTNGQLIHSNQDLHTAISFLSASVATALLVGAIIGSKTRRAAR